MGLRTPVQRKAQCVAMGNKQREGIDFNETFAPTGTFASLSLLLAIAAKFEWPVHSFDFVAAYLNSPIQEEVWVGPPPGMTIERGHGLRLLKALYGTRQAARCWWPYLKGVLLSLGYEASLYDTSLYVLRGPEARGVS